MTIQKPNKHKRSLREYLSVQVVHDILNPLIWDGDHLKPKVREHLLKIASIWQEFAKIPAKSITDIVLTGGNASYNYTDKSDIDVHFDLDYEKLPISDEAFMFEYFKDKKNLFAEDHDITIYGLPVELFAQPTAKEVHKHHGIYSLLRDEWVHHPDSFTMDIISDLDKRVEDIKISIDVAIDNGDIAAAKRIKSMIVDSRVLGVRSDTGELSDFNLIFKELRNTGYLDKLTDFITSTDDLNLSLK